MVRAMLLGERRTGQNAFRPGVGPVRFSTTAPESRRKNPAEGGGPEISMRSAGRVRNSRPCVEVGEEIVESTTVEFST